MNNEYICKAWIDGRLVEVVTTYEVDGLKPIIYGTFMEDETDVTAQVHPDEYDRIYSEICEKVVSDVYEADETACEGER